MAVKFFFFEREFHKEDAVYADPILRKVLPPIFASRAPCDDGGIFSRRYGGLHMIMRGVRLHQRT